MVIEASGGQRRAHLGWAMTAVMALLLATTAGCNDGPTAEKVCTAIEAKRCTGWSGQTECIEDGNRARSRAHEAGCDGAYQDFVGCLEADPGCGFGTMCPSQRQALEACIGDL